MQRARATWQGEPIHFPNAILYVNDIQNLSRYEYGIDAVVITQGSYNREYNRVQAASSLARGGLCTYPTTPRGPSYNKEGHLGTRQESRLKRVEGVNSTL